MSYFRNALCYLCFFLISLDFYLFLISFDLGRSPRGSNFYYFITFIPSTLSQNSPYALSEGSLNLVPKTTRPN